MDRNYFTFKVIKLIENFYYYDYNYLDILLDGIISYICFFVSGELMILGSAYWIMRKF